jgi:hypothetical protein
MKRSVWVLAVLVGMAACVGCSKTAAVADVPDTVAPADLPAADVLSDDVLDADRVPADPGAPDLGPEDPGAPDLGPPDPGAPDLGPEDPGAPDPGPVDPGPPDLGPTDPGEEWSSDTVRACVYVMENICAKALTKCDVLHLIPANWMQTCTDFLVGQHGTLKSGCQTLDEANSSDPNIQLIQSMGAPMLEACVDNFECTIENVAGVYGILQPIIAGQKLDVGNVVGVVADLCF